MGQDQFGVQMGELSQIEKDWRAVSTKIGELNQRLGQIKQTLLKATAIDLAASPLAQLPGFAIAYQVVDDVRKIGDATHRLESDKARLAQEMAQDADKIKAVRSEYEATEKKIEESLKKVHRRPAHTGLEHVGSGTSHAGSGGDGGTSSGDGGGHAGAPDGRQSSASAIPTSQVTYGGAGSWKSGQAACKEYVDQALDKMGITDPAARANWERGMLTIASRESGYNSPDWQVNKSDVNAVGAKMSDGAPAQSSRGGWQCIPSTFAAHHQPGTSTDIYDPVANCAASMNYIMSRYGVSSDGSNLAAQVQQADPNRSPRGY